MQQALQNNEEEPHCPWYWRHVMCEPLSHRSTLLSPKMLRVGKECDVDIQGIKQTSSFSFCPTVCMHGSVYLFMEKYV
jgi:hypothetical protein